MSFCSFFVFVMFDISFPVNNYTQRFANLTKKFAAKKCRPSATLDEIKVGNFMPSCFPLDSQDWICVKY